MTSGTAIVQRVYIHIGLHKTGSTYLQSILNANAVFMRKLGVYYREKSGYPAHHLEAWRMLRNDMMPLREMLHEAEEACCHTLILSSEDLEGLLFRHDLAVAAESVLYEAGVKEIEWRLSIRRPDEYFWSLFAEMSKHTYVDPFQFAFDAIKDGYIYKNSPSQQGLTTPYWYFCFDAGRYVSEFAEAVSGRLCVDDFDNCENFPGAAFLDELQLMRHLTLAVDPIWKNARLPDSAVSENAGLRFSEFLNETGNAKLLQGAIAARYTIEPAVRHAISGALLSKFAAGARGAAQMFSRQRLQEDQAA